MSISRDDLLSFLDVTYEQQPDWQHNGLQVEGKERITKIVMGVSLCGDLISEAICRNADAIIVHHGFFGKSFIRITGHLKKRLASLLIHNINLFAYHLPMDAHPVIGHNAMLSKAANLQVEKYWSSGCYCINYSNLSGLEIIQRISEFCDRKSYFPVKELPETTGLCSTTVYGTRVWAFNSSLKSNGSVSRVYICSGGSSSQIEEMEDVDLFIFGEPKESAISIARDREISMVALGHWRSEQPGLWAIGDLLVKKYGISVEYVPIVTDV